MDNSIHIEVEDEVREYLQKLAKMDVSNRSASSSYNYHVSIENEKDCAEVKGPQQVESLLKYVITPPLEKAISDAEDEADALYHLARLKKKKKKVRSY